jgi:hypothetical protein
MRIRSNALSIDSTDFSVPVFIPPPRLRQTRQIRYNAVTPASVSVPAAID